MANTKSVMARRAWGALRLAVLWARRGGSFKRGLVAKSIRVVLRNLRASGSGARIRYLEREFSFGETPAFRFKIHRPASLRMPRMPCISTPAVDFDCEDDWMFCNGENEKCENTNEEYYLSDDDEDEEENNSIELEEGEEEIDMKAEEFIVKFYEQMKMQRQVSLLQHDEMLHEELAESNCASAWFKISVIAATDCASDQ